MSEILGEGYGRILAAAREAQGLTVAQVADKLKLTSRQIEAIEAEDAARLPEPVFVRGFVRNYARMLGVPLGSLPVITEVPAAPTETITAHSEEVRFRPSPVRRWVLLPFAVFILFLVLVAALYAWLSQGEEAYVPASPTVSSQPLPAPEPVVPAAPPAVPAEGTPAPDAGVPTTSAPLPPAVLPPPSQTGGQAAAPATSVPPAAQPAPAKPVVPPTAAAAPSQVASPSFGKPVLPIAQPPVAPAATSAPAAAPTGSVHVVQLVAERNDSWIQVVSGDDKRYSRLLRIGEQLTLRGAAPFRLVIGDADGVRLHYDSRAIDLKPYTGDKVARLNLE